MSTSSLIGKINEDLSVDVIYCHWDEYYDCNGDILHSHYQNEAKVDSLLALGDISSLSFRLEPLGEEHSFENAESGCTVAYHRDRGETLSPMKHFESVEAFNTFANDNTFAVMYYLYDPKSENWYTNGIERDLDSQEVGLFVNRITELGKVLDRCNEGYESVLDCHEPDSPVLAKFKVENTQEHENNQR